MEKRRKETACFLPEVARSNVDGEVAAADELPLALALGAEELLHALGVRARGRALHDSVPKSRELLLIERVFAIAAAAHGGAERFSARAHARPGDELAVPLVVARQSFS